MRLSNLADYAIALMGETARHCGGEGVNATRLSECTAIPLPTAQKLVRMLSRAGLLTSARGAGGGVRLSRPAAAISVADIVEAIEGPIALTACVDANGRECTIESHCLIQPHGHDINLAVRGALDGISLASLAAPAKQMMKMDAA